MKFACVVLFVNLSVWGGLLGFWYDHPDPRDLVYKGFGWMGVVVNVVGMVICFVVEERKKTKNGKS